MQQTLLRVKVRRYKIDPEEEKKAIEQQKK